MAMAHSPVALRIAGYQPPETVHSRALRELERSLTQHPEDIASVSVTGSVVELGHRTADLVSLVAAGQFDMAYISSIYFKEHVPALCAFEVPFLLRSRAEALELLDRHIAPRLVRVQDEMSVRVLAIWDNGVRQLSTHVRPIRGPEDCQGLTLRNQRSSLISHGFELLGFKTVWLDIGALPGAIRDRSIDAQENPLVNICGFGIDAMHPFICLTEHLFGVTFLICNQEAYASWPRGARDAIEQAVGQATSYQRRIAAAEDDALKIKLAGKGNKLITLEPEDRRAFARMLTPMREMYPNLWCDRALSGYLTF